jgi:hypothetical protein
MPEATPYPRLAGRPRVATSRALIWIEEPRFQDWGCPRCAWVFNPSGSPDGKSFEEMKDEYERVREKEFVAQVCAEHPRASIAKA